MTPEKKAKELLNKFSSLNQWVGGEGNISLGAKMGKQCTILCVEQIIEANPYYFYPGRKVTRIGDHSTKEYWQEVKKHIESM